MKQSLKDRTLTMSNFGSLGSWLEIGMALQKLVGVYNCLYMFIISYHGLEMFGR